MFFKGYIEYPDSDLISWIQGLRRDYGDVAVQGLRVLGCSGFRSELRVRDREIEGLRLGPC